MTDVVNDPLLSVLLDRWRLTAGRPGATADEPFTAEHGDAYATDLHALLGLEVDARDVAACGTPRALAELLRARRGGGTARGESNTQDGTEATPGQAGIWYACEFGDPTAYNSPVLLRFAVTLDPELMRRALRHVVARHESLRTTFTAEDDGRLTQQISAEPRVGFSTAVAAGEDEARRLAADFAGTRLDLRTGSGHSFHGHSSWSKIPWPGVRMLPGS